MNQIKLHQRVNTILKRSSATVRPEEVHALIYENGDLYNYFFIEADSKWLNWLWKNKFFEKLKKKAEDPTRYSLKTPELKYLVKIAEDDPEGVVKVMQNTRISSKNFNPEVIDQFLNICSKLPAGQLSQMAEKISNEKWPILMASYNQWGFQYQKMFNTLKEAGDYESILILAESILDICSRKEMKSKKHQFIGGNPFYFNDLESTQVFELLASTPEKHTEKALELCISKIKDIVLLEDRLKESDIYDFKDLFALLDVDLFTLKVGGRHISYRDNIRELAAVIKQLTERLIGSRCNQPMEVKRIYKSYIDTLPKNRAMWRLQLLVLSLCPEVFKEELTTAFFKLFKVKNNYDVTSGTEYKKALKKSFYILSEEKKNEYIESLNEWYKKFEKEDGYEVLSLFSMILDYIPEKNKKDIKEMMSKHKFDYEPKPAIGQAKMSFLENSGPLADDEFNELSIQEIAKKLRSEWAPEKLREMNNENDSTKRLSAEGVDYELKEDIPKRLQEYLDHSTLFFERNVLDEHYTDSFLDGIKKILDEGKEDVSHLNWEELINLLVAIKQSGEEKTFDTNIRSRTFLDGQLSGWKWVHSTMADVIQELIKGNQEKPNINLTKHRDELLGIISYLLQHSDPVPKDEELETATSKTSSSGNSNYMVSDPFTIAVNSVRGKAFRTFLQFLFWDKKHNKKKTGVTDDIKRVYENILEAENTRAIMFMFGHYLPYFYSRDRDWSKTLFDQIFPKEKKKHHLYTASWEGCVANNLYKELFFDADMQKLYKRALDEKFDSNPQQRYFKEPDEGMATHLALAFMHYDDFEFGHPLFDAFWETNIERQAKFVNFIGRSFVAGSNAKANHLLNTNPKSKEKLIRLWDWLLDNRDEEVIFNEFGFWITLEKSLFDQVWLVKNVKRTLEKTEGGLGWEIGLMDSIAEFSEKEPEEALQILSLYLLEGGVKKGKNRIFLGDKWYEAFKALYSNTNKEIKERTYQLIDDLIREGGSIFWKLKEILDY